MVTPKKINSHIVPETYLKHFTDHSNLLYRYKIKSKFQTRIKTVSPSQVCYKPDYFRIENENTLKSFGLYDKDYIENEAFKTYENNYNSLLSKIISHNDFISTSEAHLFIETVINIKSRNEKMRKNYSKENIIPISVNLFQEIRKNRNINALFSKTDFLPFELFIKENLLNREGLENEMFLKTFIIDKRKESGFLNELISFLLSRRWDFLISDINSPFITSDNPGFCVDDKDVCANTKFGGNFMFFFPLTPQICLMICNKFIDQEDTLIKKLYFKSIPSSAIEKINVGTIKICNTEIFAHEKEILQTFLSKGI